MIRDGVLVSSGEFRDMYNEEILPQISDEYVYVNRWFHTIQETDLKFVHIFYNSAFKFNKRSIKIICYSLFSLIKFAFDHKYYWIADYMTKTGFS